MKLSRPAVISKASKVIPITLPFTNQRIIPNENLEMNPIKLNYNEDLFDRNENYLRKLSVSRNVKNLTKKIDAINAKESNFRKLDVPFNREELKQPESKNSRRRNDKFLHHRQHGNDKFAFRNEDYDLMNSNSDKSPSKGISYVDCVATGELKSDLNSVKPFKNFVILGWGKYTHSNQLSDVLLQTKVPIHNLSLCEDVYESVRLNKNQHLCAGNLNGSSGACVGDSGGGNILT